MFFYMYIPSMRIFLLYICHFRPYLPYIYLSINMSFLCNIFFIYIFSMLLDIYIFLHTYHSIYIFFKYYKYITLYICLFIYIFFPIYPSILIFFFIWKFFYISCLHMLFYIFYVYNL